MIIIIIIIIIIVIVIVIVIIVTIVVVLLLFIIYTINLLMVRPRSCRVIYYFDAPTLGRRHQSFGRVRYAPPYVPPPRRNLEETLHAFIEKQETINTQLAQTMTDFKDTFAKFT
jgi:hypothetical protein